VIEKHSAPIRATMDDLRAELVKVRGSAK
jgi:hypothetical protein